MTRSGFMKALLALGIAVAPAAAQSRNTHYGVKGTLLMPGQAYVEELDANLDINTSFGVGGMVDTRLGDKLTGGLYLDLLDVSAYDDTEMMVDLGVTLKGLLGGAAGKPSWRPEIGFGYGTLGSGGGFESTKYFTVRAGTEMVMPSGWLAEVSVYGSPSGGNNDVTVTFGPLFMLRFGKVF